MPETQTLTYTIDTAHSGIRFWIRHLMITKVHGTLSGITGTLVGSPDSPESATLETSVALSTLSTNNEQRDGHIKSPDFLDIEKYPTLSYKSSSIKKTGENTYEVEGDLTLHGVTKEVPLKAEVSDEINSPFGGLKVGVNATGVINREDFGISFNQTLDSGGIALGKEVHIEIDLELDRPA